MEFDKTKWSSPWNSDQNCTQISARGWGVGGWGVEVGIWGMGVRVVMVGEGGGGGGGKSENSKNALLAAHIIAHTWSAIIR